MSVLNTNNSASAKAAVTTSKTIGAGDEMKDLIETAEAAAINSK